MTQETVPIESYNAVVFQRDRLVYQATGECWQCRRVWNAIASLKELDGIPVYCPNCTRLLKASDHIVPLNQAPKYWPEK